MSKNVLFIQRNFYPSTLGGSCTAIYHLSTAIARDGHNVRVITSNDSIENEEYLNSQLKMVENVSVFYCDVKQSNKIHFPVIKRICKDKLTNTDVVVFGSIFYPPNFLAALIAKMKGIRIIWSPRGELYDAAINNSKVKLFYLKILRSLYSNYATFHGTSQDEIKLIEKYFGVKSNKVLIENYLRLPSVVERCEVNKYFFFIGRIAPIKALSKIIDGIGKSKLFKEQKVKFIIAGQVLDEFKEYFDNINSQINSLRLESFVEYIGPVSGEKKEHLYANAYMTLLLSESENFGNVVLESLAQGTPVIASTGTPWKSLEEENAGYWIHNDPETISNVIDKALSLSSIEYNEMRDNAKFFCRKNYSIEDNIYRWICVLNS